MTMITCPGMYTSFFTARAMQRSEKSITALVFSSGKGSNFLLLAGNCARSCALKASHWFRCPCIRWYSCKNGLRPCTFKEVGGWWGKHSSLLNNTAVSKIILLGQNLIGDGKSFSHCGKKCMMSLMKKKHKLLRQQYLISILNVANDFFCCYFHIISGCQY